MAPFELDLVNLDVICSKGKPNGTVEQRVVNWIEVHHVGVPQHSDMRNGEPETVTKYPFSMTSI